MTAGQYYSASFHASGYPAPSYSVSGQYWLGIDQFGTVSGTVPSFGIGGSFSYSVTATNKWGSAYAHCTVFIRQPFRQHHHHYNANISTYLSCPNRVFSDQRGTCTLYVTDRGGNSATNVNAQIALPSQLKADYCGFFFYGCSIFNNTASENLGTLYPGQTKSLSVTFTARTAFFLWGYHHRFAFTVKVNGSASSNGGYGFFGQSVSYSTAYVTIIPRFF
jgi:hypothetical protein